MDKTITKIRVLIADDHPLTRAGIYSLLENEQDMDVVAEAEDGEQAKYLTTKFKPDILLLDLVMPGPKPEEISSWVRTHHPETEVLILSGHARDTFLSRMMKAGAIGFVDKSEAPDQLVRSIRRAVLGKLMFSEDQLRRISQWRSAIGDRWDALSEREREVLEWMVQGLENQMIADIMGISLSTVRSHNQNIFEKLGVKNRSEAIAFVLNNSLLD